MTHRCRSGIGLRQIVVVLRCLDQQLRGLAEQHRERCRFKARQRGGREAAESERGLVSANGRIVPATDRRACARLTRAPPSVSVSRSKHARSSAARSNGFAQSDPNSRGSQSTRKRSSIATRNESGSVSFLFLPSLSLSRSLTLSLARARSRPFSSPSWLNSS